jgi:hypothetical protein
MHDIPSCVGPGGRPTGGTPRAAHYYVPGDSAVTAAVRVSAVGNRPTIRRSGERQLVRQCEVWPAAFGIFLRIDAPGLSDIDGW